MEHLGGRCAWNTSHCWKHVRGREHAHRMEHARWCEHTPRSEHAGRGRVLVLGRGQGPAQMRSARSHRPQRKFLLQLHLGGMRVPNLLQHPMVFPSLFPTSTLFTVASRHAQESNSGRRRARRAWGLTRRAAQSA